MTTNSSALQPRAQTALTLAGFLMSPMIVVAPRATPVVLGVCTLAAAAARGADALRIRPLKDLSLLLPLAGLAAFFLLSAVWSLAPGHSISTALKALGISIGGFLFVSSAKAFPMQSQARFARAFATGYGVAILLLAVEGVFAYPLNSLLRNLVGDEAMEAHRIAPSLSLMALLLWPAASATTLWLGRKMSYALIAAAVVVISGFQAIVPILALVSGLAILLLASIRLPVVKIASGLVLAFVMSAPFLFQALPSMETIHATAPHAPVYPLHRLEIWRFTGKTALDKPWLGWGMGTSRFIAAHEAAAGNVPTAYISENQTTPERWIAYFRTQPLPLHPHNAALQVWLELGFAGAVLFSWLLWQIFARAGMCLSERTTTLAIALASACACVAFSGFGVWQSWWLSSLWLLAAFMALIGRKTEA